MEYLNGEFVLLLRLAVLVVLGDVHLAGLDLGDLGVADPLDVAVAHRRFQQALGVAHAAEAEVPDIGLRGDEGHRHLVADLAPAQVGVHDHGELVGGTETGCHLHGAHHDMAGILDELVPYLGGLHGVVDMAHRLRMAVGSEALHFLECQLRSGGDDEKVVVDHSAVGQLDLVPFRVHPLDRCRDEVDLLARQGWADVDLDVVALAPIHGKPRVGRHEVELRVARNDGDLVLRAGALAHFVGHRHAADACSHNNDVCHVSLLGCNKEPRSRNPVLFFDSIF